MPRFTRFSRSSPRLVVISRRHRVVPLLRKNWAICLFFLYAAFSISWSDYPFVTLKHSIKGVGDLMMVMIILTEPSVPKAIKRVSLTRLAFLLVPISVLFIKYYGTLGRRLTLGWTMEASALPLRRTAWANYAIS